MYKRGSWERFWQTGLIVDYLAYRAGLDKLTLVWEDGFELNPHRHDRDSNTAEAAEG